MALQLHRIPKNRRYPPPWYHLHPEPFFTSRPSARMEKQYTEERRREWQWQATEDTKNFDSAVCEALCWPCGVYSRIQHRLRNAIRGRNPIDIGEQPFCSSDCATFCVCLPFYGFLIAKMQGSIREYYNIDGSEFGDWTDGFFCPPLTLVRDENEIVYRERNGDGYDTGPYKSPPPMGTSSSSSSGNLNTIPEASRDPSTRASSRHPSRGRTGLHSIAADCVYPIEAAASPHVHYLDQDPTMLPPADTSHELRQDPTSRQATTPARRHSLATDHVAPLPRPTLQHEIHQDQTVPPPAEAAPHHLAGDIMSSFPGRQPAAYTPATFPAHEHELHDDPPVSAPRPAGATPHELHHDGLHATPSDTPAALHGSRATAAHELHDDVVHPTPLLHGRQLAPAHGLHDDEMVEVHPPGRTHQLHDHNHQGHL